MRGCALLLLVLAAAFCGLGHGPADAQKSRYKEVCADRPAVAGDTLYFCGTLDDDFVKFLTANASPKTRTLVITSYGGHVPSTIDALEIVEGKGLKIIVEGVCASACAQFLFIPASKGEVLPGAILALHTTSTSMRAMRLREDWKDYEQLRPLMDVAADEEKAFYIRHGLDPRLLLEPALAMRPACISEVVDWTNPQWPRTDYFARYLWWIPRKAELERFGMKPKDGFWVETLSDMQLLGTSIKKYHMGNSAVGGNAALRMNAEQLGKLSKCKAPDKARP